MSVVRTEHRRRTLAWVVAAASVVWLASLATVAADELDLEVSARRVEGKLMAPCCMANTVAEHYSSVAFEMRNDIREMLGAGQSEQEILDHYVGKYGDQVLAAPAARGFNLVAYLLPFLLLLAGTGSLLMVVRRLASKPACESRDTESTVIEPEQAERLRRALYDFDSAN